MFCFFKISHGFPVMPWPERMYEVLCPPNLVGVTHMGSFIEVNSSNLGIGDFPLTLAIAPFGFSLVLKNHFTSMHFLSEGKWTNLHVWFFSIDFSSSIRASFQCFSFKAYSKLTSSVSANIASWTSSSWTLTARSVHLWSNPKQTAVTELKNQKPNQTKNR